MPAEAHQVVTADYRVPFLAHATMEPMVCSVRVEGDHADVWAGVQDPLNARAAAAEALDLDPAQVDLTNLQLGGGYGRRLPFTFDYIDLGARIAKEMSPTPVKTVWSRENDIQHDYYRPAGMSRFAGALDESGTPLVVACHYAGGGDGESVYMPYSIAETRAEGRDAAHPIRLGRLAVGPELTARVFQRVVRRRAGPRGRQRPVPFPTRSAERSASLSGCP